MTYLVAGAGVTGLTAALRLAEGGADVVVVDPADRIGGMVQTSPFAGRMVDEAADAFLVRTPAAVDLARHVGLGPELVHPARRDARLWLHGALHRLPTHVLGVPVDIDEVEGSRVLSPDGLERLRADLSRAPDAPSIDDVSVAEAVGGRLGEEALARLVDPLVSAISAGDTARLSLAAVAPQLDAAWRDPVRPSLMAACRAQVDAARAAVDPALPAPPVFAAPVGGMVRLPQALARAARTTGRVELRLGSTLTTVERSGRVVLDGSDTLDVDGVVVATPGWAAAGIVADASPEAGALLAEVPHVSVAFVRLALHPHDIGRPLDASGVLLPREEGRALTACSWTSAKWSHLAPERGDGTALVRAAVGRDGDPSALELDDADLVARVVDELTPIVGLLGAPAATSVHRWPSAFPQYRPGHLERVTAVEMALARDLPRVALAGMHLRGVGIPASVASGQRAADRLLAGGAPRTSA